MTTYETVKGIVAKILHVQPEDIIPTASLKDLNADSLDLVQILVGVEEAFDIEISDKDAEGLRSLESLVECVDRYVAAKPRS